jgi:alpha-tubulin suppressor-like RCC1 family protein
MPNQFFSPEGDIEKYFVSEYWLIDQYVGDQLWVWGNGSYGRLGNRQLTNRNTPLTTFAGGTNWKQVSAGDFHVSAIKTDGTLWTWGAGGGGRLGNGATTGNISTPVTTFAGGTNWKQVSVGNSYTAAIKTDGTLWTWGFGTNSQLGNANTTNRSTPVTTFAGGNDWKQVSAGGFYATAIKTNGTLWTWGSGIYGQLGNNQIVNRSTPVTTFAGGNNWKQVSSGRDHTTAIKTDGILWIWGRNHAAQLGTNDTTNRSTPVTTFAGGSNWKQVSAAGTSLAGAHTAAIKTDGTLWTWGNGGFGRLGDNQTTVKSTPVTTFAGGTNWKQVSATWSSNTSAIKTDGTLWTWGASSAAELGNNSTGSRSTPITTFAGGTNWKQVSSQMAIQAGINAEYPLS